jgi:hypothetical protein
VGVLSDERTGLTFLYAAGTSQRSLSWVQIPFGLVPIFYCLRFETSHFVASYDLQGHSGGIRPRLLFIITLHGPNRKFRFQQLIYCFHLSIAADTCLLSPLLAMDVSSGCTIPSFGFHVTILFFQHCLKLQLCRSASHLTINAIEILDPPHACPDVP